MKDELRAMMRRAEYHREVFYSAVMYETARLLALKESVEDQLNVLSREMEDAGLSPMPVTGPVHRGDLYPLECQANDSWPENITRSEKSVLLMCETSITGYWVGKNFYIQPRSPRFRRLVDARMRDEQLSDLFS